MALVRIFNSGSASQKFHFLNDQNQKDASSVMPRSAAFIDSKLLLTSLETLKEKQLEVEIFDSEFQEELSTFINTAPPTAEPVPVEVKEITTEILESIASIPVEDTEPVVVEEEKEESIVATAETVVEPVEPVVASGFTKPNHQKFNNKQQQTK